jgi:dUTP pyrophosphatase
MKVKLKIFTDELFRKPVQATPGSAGWDIYAIQDNTLPPREMKIIKTGFGIQVPRGYYVSLVPRSSFGKKKIVIANSPGTIDSDYTGEISIMLYNLSDEFFYIKQGDRIAQMLLLRYDNFEFQVVEDFDSTERGEGGFGSTNQVNYWCGVPVKITPTFEEEGD